MRTRLLPILALIAGCGSNPIKTGQDLSAGNDLSMSITDLATAGMCDIVTQDCSDPSKGKCTLFPSMMMGGNDVHQCVPNTGTNTEGQPCNRTTFGDDDCVKGTVCTLRGVPAGSFVCRKWCHADADCPTNQKCSGQVSGMFPQDGLCTPTCTPFGSDCVATTTCGFIFPDTASTMTMPKLVMVCRAVGTVPVGGDCSAMGDTDCVADTICDPSAAICIPLCDDTHACPGALDDSSVPDGGGLMCQTIPSLTAGVCQ
jgi:hypothetical protein